MYTMICGSPKVRISNSIYFLNFISKRLDQYNIYELKKDQYENIINSLLKSDTIVLAFPLYVDSPPSITLKFLDYILDKKIKINDKKIYVIINCGFREGEQNIIGLNIIKRWCSKVNAKYMGSILIGAGEIVGKEKFRLISQNALKKLNIFANKIKNKESSEDIITTLDLINNQMYCYMANISWYKKGKKYKLSKSDLKYNKIINNA